MRLILSFAVVALMIVPSAAKAQIGESSSVSTPVAPVISPQVKAQAATSAPSEKPAKTVEEKPADTQATQQSTTEKAATPIVEKNVVTVLPLNATSETEKKAVKSTDVTKYVPSDKKKEVVLSDEDVNKSLLEAEKKLNELIAKIIDGASPQDRDNFYTSYAIYNLLDTVKMVQGDVKKAVDSCKNANPDMRSKLGPRFDTWQGAITPVLKIAQTNLDTRVKTQTYAKPAQIRGAFKYLSANRTLVSSQIKKEPVTTPEACQFLLEKMDETQDNLIQLINSTMINPPPGDLGEGADKVMEDAPADKTSPEKP